MHETLTESFKARDALIWLCTDEEERALSRLQEVAAGLELELYDYDPVSGFRCVTTPDLRPPNCDGAGNVDGVLRTIEEDIATFEAFVQGGCLLESKESEMEGGVAA